MRWARNPGARWRQRGWPLAGLAAVSLALSCGRTNQNTGSSGSTDVGQNADQALVPPQIQKPDVPRYFMVNDKVVGPEMVVFEDPRAPRVISLTHPEGSYDARLTRWSASGQRFAYQLVAKQTGITPVRLMLADLNQDFQAQAIEHPDLTEEAFQMAWVGDRALVLETGSYIDVPDARGWIGRYLWIDAQSGAVTNLGNVPSPTTPYSSVARDLTKPSVWASAFGAVFVDDGCNLVYLQAPGATTTLLKDCSAQAEWSGDASFLMVTTDTERALYERVEGQLRRVEPASPSFAQSFEAHWRWAPSAPRFVIYEGGGSLDTHLTSLTYGDARSAELHAFPSLPSANYVYFATDELLLAPDWAGKDYALDVSQLGPNDDAALVPLLPDDHPDTELVVSHDSSRVYYVKNPLDVLELSQGHPGPVETLFTETQAVAQVKFRLLDTDNAGLLTMIEPGRKPPGGGDSTGFYPHHQYLLNLGPERAVIPLGSFNQAAGTDALGIRTFQSAPQFGGIFYVGESAHGLYVDWLGFDDISHRLRLLEFVSNLAGVNLPVSVTPN